MAAKVYVSGADDPDEYGDGTGLDIRENHLIVSTGDAISPRVQQRIAIYAPGHWKRAEVTK